MRGHVDACSPGLGEPRRIRRLAALAAALNASFYVLVFLVLAGAVAALALVVLLFGGLGLYLIMFPAGVLVAAVDQIIRSALPARRAGHLSGIAVGREDQPRLWALVDEVCERVGQRRVDGLRITLTGSAGAAEVGRSHRRMLWIPLTYLTVLGEDELRGVVAHELYHFAQGDTRFARRLVTVRDALARTIWRLDRIGSVLRYPFRWYGRLLSTFLASLSREQEFAADAFAAANFGAANVAKGLRVIEWAHCAFAAFWQAELAAVLSEGLRPPLSTGYALFMSSHLPTGLAAFKPEPPETTLASHPALVDRLAALKADADGCPEIACPALSRIDELDELEAALLRDKQEPAGREELRRVDWLQALQITLPKAWRSAARAWSDRLPPLTAVEIATSIDDCVSDADRTDAELLQLVGALSCSLASSLVGAGWSINASPGGPVRLLHGHQEVRPFEDLWGIARSELLRAEWADRCYDVGIESLVLTFTAADPVAPDPLSQPQQVTLSLHADEARGPISRGATWLCWIVGAIWVPILLVGATQIPGIGPAIFIAGMACLVACGMAWLFVTQRSLKRDPPRFRFDEAGLTLTHPGLLKEPLRVPTQAIRVVALDARDRRAALRFPIFADSEWSDPYVQATEPQAWFWVEGRPAQPTPYFGLREHAPNLLVLFDEPVSGPRVRRQRLHGPLNGETLSALMLTVADAGEAEDLLSDVDLARRLVLSDFRPLRRDSGNRQLARASAV